MGQCSVISTYLHFHINYGYILYTISQITKGDLYNAMKPGFWLTVGYANYGKWLQDIGTKTSDKAIHWNFKWFPVFRGKLSTHLNPASCATCSAHQACLLDGKRRGWTDSNNYKKLALKETSTFHHRGNVFKRSQVSPFINICSYLFLPLRGTQLSPSLCAESRWLHEP